MPGNTAGAKSQYSYHTAITGKHIYRQKKMAQWQQYKKIRTGKHIYVIPKNFEIVHSYQLNVKKMHIGVAGCGLVENGRHFEIWSG